MADITFYMEYKIGEIRLGQYIGKSHGQKYELMVCSKCNKYVWVRVSDISRNGWRLCRFCSTQNMGSTKRPNTWSKGKKFTEDHKKKLSLSHLGKTSYWMGRHRSQETKDKIRESLFGRKRPAEVVAKLPRGENHHSWKGGVSFLNENHRKSKAFIAWRLDVYQRDNFTCKLCGKHGGRLNAHHILKFSDYPDKRYDVSNGITLCIPCHARHHAKEHYANSNNIRFGNN